MSRRSLLGGIAATSALVLLHPFTARAAANQAHLRLMETTDIHVDVFPYDYYADKPNDTMGLSRTATIIDAIRAEAANSLLIDNGDVLQGNPMGDYIAYQRGMKEGDVHPVIKAMNTLGYDGRHARQSRVQLRPRLHVQGAGRRELPVRLRQPDQGPARLRSEAGRAVLQALHHRRKEDQGRRRRRAARSRSASSASCRRRSCSGMSRTSKARRNDARHRPGRQGLGARR